jgi:GGDEF domain-containing protein
LSRGIRSASTIALVLIWSSLAFVASILNMNARLSRIGSVEAEALARADALTGLGNRRAFDERSWRRSPARAGSALR